MARLAPPPLLRGRAPSALLAAAALLLAAGPARAQTYSTICGPATLTIPNATLAAGSFQRAVRCGYTLAGSAIFMQSFTLLNPQGALIRVMSARDANCEQPYLPYAPSSDNALGYTTTSTSFAMTGQPQSATGDSSGEPRVCIYVGCAASTTCSTSGLALDSYYGKRQTSSGTASGGSSSSSVVGGVVGGIILLVIIFVVFSWVWRCKAMQQQLQMQQQAQMQMQAQMAVAQPQVMVQGGQPMMVGQMMGGQPMMGAPYGSQVRRRAARSRARAFARSLL